MSPTNQSIVFLPPRRFLIGCIRNNAGRTKLANGPFDHTARLIRFARERNLIWVLTSAFESSLALGAFCRFAQQFDPGDTAMGLNTHTVFEKEFITPVTVMDGKMHYPSRENRVLDHSMLQEIDLEGGNKP